MHVPARTQASCDPCSAADLSDDWDMVVIRRHGAPPLRFAGRLFCHGHDGDASVRIWQARTGGFILAHSLETPGRETSSRHAEAEEVMLTLEAYCRGLDTAADLPMDMRTARRLHMADLLEDLARLSDWRRRFRALAGEVLDRFEQQLSADAAQQAGGMA